VSAHHANEILWTASISREVATLRWPQDADEAERLDRAGVAHLLLVENDQPCPETISCTRDWIRLPARENDIRARLLTLQRRSERHPPRPVIEEHGRFSYRGKDVYLSPLDHEIVAVLARHFDRVVSETELLAIWPASPTPNRLRVHISRLRKQLEPLGLTVISRRREGYAIRKLTSNNERIDTGRHDRFH
jgi:hypothetical protein